jgi:hypothetical protein
MQSVCRLSQIVVASALVAALPAEAIENIHSDKYKVIEKFEQPAGPNRERALVRKVRCDDQKGSGREILIYGYPDRKGPERARAVVPGTFAIIGNYPDMPTAVDKACSNTTALNVDGEWFLEMHFCKFAGKMSGYGQSYKFEGAWTGQQPDVQCHGYYNPPGKVTCEIKGPFGRIDDNANRAKGTTQCTVSFDNGNKDNPTKTVKVESQTGVLFVINQGQDWCVVRDPQDGSARTRTDGEPWVRYAGDIIARKRRNPGANLNCPNW